MPGVASCTGSAVRSARPLPSRRGAVRPPARPVRRVSGVFAGHYTPGFESTTFVPCAADAWFVSADLLDAYPFDARRAWARWRRGAERGLRWPKRTRRARLRALLRALARHSGGARARRPHGRLDVRAARGLRARAPCPGTSRRSVAPSPRRAPARRGAAAPGCDCPRAEARCRYRTSTRPPLRARRRGGTVPAPASTTSGARRQPARGACIESRIPRCPDRPRPDDPGE